jgi:hypothetical protein
MSAWRCSGGKQVLVRAGFSEYDTYGFGFYAAAMGNLDAPDFIPQGSVRLHNTGKPSPTESIAHRDGDDRPLGCPHDGPEPATLWLEGRSA